MPTRDISTTCRALRCERGACRPCSVELIRELPLLVRVDGRPWKTVMRTPGDEAALAAGLCLTEGLAQGPDDLASVAHDPDADAVDVRLEPGRRRAVQALLDRGAPPPARGKPAADLCRGVAPVQADLTLAVADLCRCLDALVRQQKHYETTRGSHAALLLDSAFASVAFAEDVGRHNALDKAAGRALLERSLDRAAVLVISSRLSFELVRKAACARLPVLVSASRPTALAVDAARGLGVTVAVSARPGAVTLLCDHGRVSEARGQARGQVDS